MRWLGGSVWGAILVVFILFISLSLSVASEPIVLTDDVQLRLADAFLEQGEYYRAITEFKKLLILFPDSESADYAFFAIGLCYFKGDQYDKTEEALASFRKNRPTSPLNERATYLEGLACLKAKHFTTAQGLFALLSDRLPPSEYSPLSLVALSLVAYEQEQMPDAARYLKSFLDRYPLHPDGERVRKALILLDDYTHLPKKSPVLAAILSTVLPGAGYVYANRSGDGAMAFLVNGLFVGSEVAAWQAENIALGAIIGGVGLPFYLGNIWGSANAARKQNAAMGRTLREEISRVLDFIYIF